MTESLYSKKVEQTEEWQYALTEIEASALHGRFYEEEQRWVSESSEFTASLNSITDKATGEIRSRKITTTVEHYAYDGDDSIAERTTVEKMNWVVKKQNLLTIAA